MKRMFNNRQFKNNSGEKVHFISDSYTENEMNIFIGKNDYGVWTMISKTSLREVAENLRNKKDLVFSNHSNFDNRPFFEATKTNIGYSFKSEFGNTVELPFTKVEKMVDYLQALN